MKTFCFYFLISFLSFNFCLAKFSTSLTNGIIGQFSHLYTHLCMVYDSSSGTNIFRSCVLSNDNNLFQLQYYNPSTDKEFYILSYSSTASQQQILYVSSSNFYYTSTSSYCLQNNNNCYYYYSRPGINFQFYANFSRGNTNNQLGTFTLQNMYNKKCISLDILNNEVIYSFKTCDPNDLTQIFGFLTPDTYLMNQISSTAALDTSKSLLKITWSNPNKIDNIAYMIIPGNQTVSDQRTLNLQNVKCTSRNGLSPLTFEKDGNNIITSISTQNMEACNIYPKSNGTITSYDMKAIHLFLDNSIGFSRSIQIYFQDQLQLEQMYLVGQTSDNSEQTQVFESSVNSFELTNQIDMNFIQSIGQTYLPSVKQNLTISVNSTSKFSLTLVGNSMSLLSVNATNNQVITQKVPSIYQSSGVNQLNMTFDLSNIASNYYKFKIIIKLTNLVRILQSTDNDTSASQDTLTEYNSPDIYYIGSYQEIQDLINKLNSNNNSNNLLVQESNDKKTIIIAVILSIALLSVIALLIWKRDKLFVKKKNNKEEDQYIVPQETQNIEQNNNENKEKVQNEQEINLEFKPTIQISEESS